jgi:prevent-host-death family protein
MSIWQSHEAKAHFSEFVRASVYEGPQVVSVRGIEEAVLISKKDYDNLVGTPLTFLEFIAKSPLKGIQLDIERDKSSDRDIEL